MITNRHATVTYLRNRERVLGGRDEIPSGDPIADAHRVMELLGGRSLAERYVRQMLAGLERAWPVDDHGRRIDYAAVIEAVEQ